MACVLHTKNQRGKKLMRNPSVHESFPSRISAPVPFLTSLSTTDAAYSSASMPFRFPSYLMRSMCGLIRM